MPGDGIGSVHLTGNCYGLLTCITNPLKKLNIPPENPAAVSIGFVAMFIVAVDGSIAVSATPLSIASTPEVSFSRLIAPTS